MSLSVPDLSSKPYQIFCGDALSVLHHLSECGLKIDCTVTSPPYFAQRVYGADAAELGQEKQLDDYIANLVAVFQAIPLQPWGSIWVNLGDKRGKKGELLAVPLRFCSAMQAAGFFLIDNVVWAKEVVPVDCRPVIETDVEEEPFHTIGHTMIEPAPGRLNGNGWEPFYRFVLDPKRAWADTCAVRIPRDPSNFFDQEAKPIEQTPYNPGMQCVTSIVGRNATNVWHVGTSAKGKGHFAAMPAALVERPIAMTCPQWLVDNEGEVIPRERRTEPTVYCEAKSKSLRVFGQYSLVKDEHSPDEASLSSDERAKLEALRHKAGRMDAARHYTPKYPLTSGWTHEDKPSLGAGIVLDPFGGTGTSGAVALRLGRRFVGIDLYPEVAERMEKRCAEVWQEMNPPVAENMEEISINQ